MGMSQFSQVPNRAAPTCSPSTQIFRSPLFGHLVVIVVVPIRVLLLLVWATLVQILVIAMCFVLPLTVVTVIVDGLLRLLRLAANHRYGTSYRYCEQDWAEAPK
jgi:hypothetical protein